MEVLATMIFGAIVIVCGTFFSRELFAKDTIITPDEKRVMNYGMRSDLQSLVLSEKDFKEFTGMSLHSIVDSKPGNELYWLCTIFSFLSFTSFYIIMIINANYFGHRFFWIGFLCFLGIGVFLGTMVGGFLRETRMKMYTTQESLRGLILEIMKYNDILRGINIKDQLENAGNKGVAAESRLKLLEALQLTRADLIRALKTEKILRDNRSFISQNPEMFTSNLSAINAIKINDQAGEWGRLFDQTMQVSITVQEEMRRIQEQDHDR
jgi:hypothetical protein